MSPTESGRREFALRRSLRLPGMSNPGTGICPSAVRRPRLRELKSLPERGSSQFALRRSPRLLGKFASREKGKSAMTMPKRSQLSLRKSPAKGKSAITMPKRRQISPCKSPDKGKSAMTMPESPVKSPDYGKSAMTMPDSPCKSPAKGHGTTFRGHDYLDIDTLMRFNRECEAQHFKEMYTFSTDCRAKKTCIHPGGVFAWEDKSSSGISWVAVRGRNTTCVVFKSTLEHVKDRLRSYLRYNSPGITYSLFSLTVISEIEVLADVPSESDQKFECGDHVHKPFAIVSVEPSTTNDLGEIVDKEAAVKYLKGILKKDEFFYRDEAEEAAIRAFQLLYNQKFEADDIMVASAFSGGSSLSRNDIKSHLEVINQTTDEYKDHLAGSCSACTPDNYQLDLK